ncbi:TolC family protein [Spirosoma sp. KCTC 42546]|uniref:TolC family protein n=1 Tax=Spirosoma sp. KCTC 42546 TaxID=2520506 RepID=UPI0011571708|nr:TolC family protein [Spirosoma sp. KCTC 42546]QDK79693.1 TolC family protein [Spirosoma sp. KCTC 42546]
MRFRLFRLHTILISRISLFLLLGALTTTVCSGQSRGVRGLVSFGASSGLADDTLYLDINQDIAIQLLPFEELMKVAIAHSPVVKYQNEVANSLNEAHEIAKVQILQNVAGFGNYSTGNQILISSGGAAVPGGGIVPESTLGQIANGYRVGIDVRLPLYELFGRKHQVRQASANYKAAVHQKETVELQLKRELIGIYQDMITTQQLLKILLIDEQASLTALRVAEVEIQKGQITADLMASVTSRYVQAKTASEQAKGNFLKNVHYFEALMGMPIQRLKRN